MRVLVTGAAGFIGHALVRELARAAADGGSRPITQLVLADRVACGAPEVAGVDATSMAGDLADPAFVQALAGRGFDSIYHLAASLTLDAERDPDAAFAINVAAVRHLIAASPAPPRLVFTSSIAVFGGPLPDTVDDTVRPTPTTTYGAHKAMVELLLADATRHGRIDGRALRLPIVLIRPGAATPTISDRVAAIAREPLAGRDVACPLAPATRMPVASAAAVARALVRLHDLPASSLPASRAMNLPALTVSVAEMVAAVERRRPTGRITIAPEPTLQAIVDGWPKRFVSADATRLGLAADADFDAILTDHLAGQNG